MDSWTLQGDSYSFLHSAPRNFSLCHRDGTPNHVEIFDIISVPTQRSSISETTCLCDIFGDDCETPSLSSSPAVGTFVPSQREVDGESAASPLVDDLNDSSGSYHTAPGSSEGEEGFEDPKERLFSPLFSHTSSERKQLQSEGLTTGHPEGTSPDLERKSKSPAPEFNTTTPSSEVHSFGERTPSPGYNSPHTLNSSLSSSSVEKRHSPSSPYLRNVYSEAEPGKVTPTLKDSPSVTPSSPSESRNCARPSSPQSVNYSPEFMVAEVFPEPRNYFNECCNPSSEPPSNTFSTDFTETVNESSAILPFPSPSPTSAELSLQSRETLVSPDVTNRLDSPDTQTSSPFPELRGRVSLPDLFSRGSTPHTEDTPGTPKLISEPTTPGRDSSTTPENLRLEAQPVSTVSTPAPQYTHPSPVTLTVASTELVESSVSPVLGLKTPSPALLRAASPFEAAARTPSPKISHISTSEIRTTVPLPDISYSSTPSPEISSSCSPTECIHNSPSPEPKDTASSPEVSGREQTSEVETASTSLLETHFDSASSTSLTSSPHITGISYTVIQPEDRATPPFTELFNVSTYESERTLVSPKASSPTLSRDRIQSNKVESPGASQDSLPGFTNCVLQPEISLSHHPRYRTVSPQPTNHTSPTEQIYKNPSTERYQSPSPRHRSRDPTPSAPSPKQRYNQHSPPTLSTEYNPRCTQLIPVLRNRPEAERDIFGTDITKLQYHTNLAKDNMSAIVESDSENNAIESEIRVRSQMQALQLSVSTSPFLAEVADSSVKQQSPERRRRTTTEVQEIPDLASFSEVKQGIHPTIFQKDTYNHPSLDIESASPDLIVSKDRNTELDVTRVTSSSAVQELEHIRSYSMTADSSSSSTSSCTAKHLRKQPLTQVRGENKERLTDMARHINRAQTPSPPLTRFTPVHIIAPEKPYRKWQNRSHSPSQVVAFSPSGNLKKEVANRENPSVPSDNNSQDPWVRLGRQLEMEREMQLVDEREVGRQRERKREEQVPEKGKGWQGDTSYRGEQVELSFNARNRKGPVSRGTAQTSRETLQGLPTLHSYSESLLATRQLQQQQKLLRRASQQDSRGGGPTRQLKPSAPQNKNSAPRHVAASRPRQSSSSSMGSELDDADNEVKWFTDLAFRSLSSPDVDYLDVYNSSHHSSTNISQPSTQESPAGNSASWLAYADFRGSAPKLDSDELPFQQLTAHYSEGLDPARRYEMGSFECVDVAVEREDFRKVRRGVPKRQIQLKRKNNTEGKQDESSENSSPGVPMMLGDPSLESHSKETFMRQHSTPATMQECYPSEDSPEPIQQNVRKSRLQKSVSLDETGTKTKMATCLIKSVLSKKMQSVDKQPEEQVGEVVSPAFEENHMPTECTVAPLKESPKPDTYPLSSSLQSDCSISSDGLSFKRTKDEPKPRKSYAVRSSSRPSSSSSSRSVNFSQTDSEEADSQNMNAASLRFEIRSELKVPFDMKTSRKGMQQADDDKVWYEREGGQSANATHGNSGAPSDTEAQQQMTSTDQESQGRDHKQLQQAAYMSKTQDITLKAMEKKKTSLSVCLTPEVENKPEASSPDMSFREKEERTEIIVDQPMEEEEEEGHGNTKVKTPIHKVRDVRRLVKNTYNLSFKATSSVLSSDVNEEKREEICKERQEEVMTGEEKELIQEIWQEERSEKTEEEFRVQQKEEEKQGVKDLTSFSSLQSKENPPSRPQPMQIEYKAVCWKEDKNKMSCSKKDSENFTDKPQASPKLVAELSRESQKSSNANTQDYTTLDKVIVEPCQHDLINMAAETQETVTEIHKLPDNEEKSVVVRTDRKPPMLGSLPRVSSKEREVSTAVVMIRDASSKTKTSSSPAQDKPTTPLQAAAVSPLPGPITPGSTSVSMLLKEKGYQADIGAVMGDSQNVAGRKRVPRKHVNSLEIPLQIATTADGCPIESRRERTFSSSSSSGPSVEDEAKKSTGKDTVKQKSAPPPKNVHEQAPPVTKQKELGDFEAVKRLDPTFPPRSPALRRSRPQSIEVKSLSKETQKEEMLSTRRNKPQTIEVKSIAKNSQKPTVPPKPSCKFKPSDLGVVANEGQRALATSIRPHGDDRPQTIVVSSPTIYRKISNESMSTSNYTRKLAVSAVSSLKPPPSKTAATTSCVSNQSSALSKTETSVGREEQQHVAASPESSRGTQRPTLTTALTSDTGPSTDSTVNSPPAPVSDPTANQPSLSAAVDPDNQPQHPDVAYPQEQAMPTTTNITKQHAAVSTAHVPGYTHQSSRRSLSSERSQRTDNLHFYASDDPPSYDERESFSPLILPDLTHRRSGRYQPTSQPLPCSCASHPGFTHPHPHRSPHGLTPPAPPHSPGHALPYHVAQPPLRPHQCRPDHQPISYQRGSPKSSPLGPNHPPALCQPLHQPPPCPPHPSLMQACTVDRPLQPPQHVDPRRPPLHRSPQQQPPVMTGVPYSDPGHSHSPGLPPIDPQYLCGPPSLGPSYGSEYGGDSSSLYSESSYGQTPRRVLMDPETGKYFYIEVPVQPLRKMLFDPETGQYVEVLIPQQAMSHSSLYPPSAAPYPSLHNPSMYNSAPQYMPYAAPAPPAHPQAQTQPPRYPEAPAAATMLPSGPGISYRNPSVQGSKPESQSHPALDQSYLESMYYVPTGINTSPNPTPPEYYHKRPSNLPPAGGKRS